MNVTRLLITFCTALLLLTTTESLAQRDRSQNPKRQAKQQAEMRQEREEKFDADMKARGDRHVEIQDKETRKRMKKNRRRSERIAKYGTDEPFFKRLFRRRHFR